MATMANTRPAEPGGTRDKGLRAGTLGLVSSTVIGIASTAPAYSLAATLGFIVAAVGLQTPVVVIIAFVPILFVAIGYAELNKSMPDCGTTFTWATRAFGPRTGWMGLGAAGRHPLDGRDARRVRGLGPRAGRGW